MEAFAGDREKYGEPNPARTPGTMGAPRGGFTSEGWLPPAVPPLPSEQVPQNQLRMADAISAMEEERHRLDLAIRLAQIRLLEEARPEWNASKVIEAAEWADRSRGQLRQIAAGVESLLESTDAPYRELRRMLEAVAERINTLGP